MGLFDGPLPEGPGTVGGSPFAILPMLVGIVVSIIGMSVGVGIGGDEETAAVVGGLAWATLLSAPLVLCHRRLRRPRPKEMLVGLIMGLWIVPVIFGVGVLLS